MVHAVPGPPQVGAVVVADAVEVVWVDEDTVVDVDGD